MSLCVGLLAASQEPRVLFGLEEEERWGAWEGKKPEITSLVQGLGGSVAEQRLHRNLKGIDWTPAAR